MRGALPAADRPSPHPPGGQSYAPRAKSAECFRIDHTLCSEARGSTAMLSTGYNGILGLLILVGDVWAIINIFQSSASNEKKLIWTVIVLLLPLLGLILWFFLGPKSGRT
jgi:hypothetical protein